MGAHSSALFTTARAAAPSATVSPITASLTKRLVLGFVKMDFVRSSPRSRSLKRCLNTVSGLCCTDANSKSLKVEAAVLQEKKRVKEFPQLAFGTSLLLGRKIFMRKEDLARGCTEHMCTWAALHSPFSLLLSCLPGKFGWWELDKKVPSSADQSLVRKVLWDLGQEVVDRGHVALAVQNFLLPVQHDLQRGVTTLRTAREEGMTPCPSLALTSDPEEKNISLPAERPAIPQGDTSQQSTPCLGKEMPNLSRDSEAVESPFLGS